MLKFQTIFVSNKENCTFSKTHINEVIRFLANTARYSPPTFFTMESTKYKSGSFSADGAWSDRKLRSLEDNNKTLKSNSYLNWKHNSLNNAKKKSLPVTTNGMSVFEKDEKKSLVSQGRKKVTMTKICPKYSFALGKRQKQV